MAELIIDHATCPESSHDRDPEGAEEQAVDEAGLTACNNCQKPIFYCSEDEDWHHLDPKASCFLIP